MANDIVSVQAMNLPIGKLFYFVPKIQAYAGGNPYFDPQTPLNNYDGSSGSHLGPVGAPGNYPGSPTSGYTTGNQFQKNLYDLFYEGNEGQLDPPGLFDYSKGQWSAITVTTNVQVWSNGTLIDYTNEFEGLNVRKVIVSMCGFANAGNGKLIGPDGNEYDSETFLSDLRIYSTNDFQGGGCTNLLDDAGNPNSLLFRVVTQQYGQGIVSGLNVRTATTWPTDGNGGSYNDICSPTGCIYLEVDLSCPICATCDSTSLDV